MNKTIIKNRRSGLPSIDRGRNGQVMILTVLALGGAILGATTIAGLLMLYQIRQATDLANSGKAIYAADAGLEYSLYNWFCSQDGSKSPCPVQPIVFQNGASLVVNQFCYGSDGSAIACDISTASSTTFKSVGTSGNSSRAFGLSF